MNFFSARPPLRSGRGSEILCGPLARVLTGRARLTWETAVLVRMNARTRGEFLAGESRQRSDS